MTPTIAEIAAGLSEAQQRALIDGQCEADPTNGACLCGFPERAILWDLGLVERKGTSAVWRTRLGVAVRDFLREGEEGRG